MASSRSVSEPIEASEEIALPAPAVATAVRILDYLSKQTPRAGVTEISRALGTNKFLLAECLALAGCDAGLDRDTAMRLARATVSGAGELLHQSKDDPAVLRQNVTSPGGTTAAALTVLMREQDGLQKLLREADRAALKRAKELAS